jgi:hypothetical protein
MGIAIALVGLVLTTGYAVVRLLGLAKGASAVGLVPAAGLATLAVVTTWCGLLGAPAPSAGILVLICSLVGVGLAVVDREWLLTAVAGLLRHDRLAAVVLGAAVVVPLVAIGVAFAQVQAPLSPHDGAFHVETSDTFRRGMGASSWYPPGLAALFGAVLQLAPWVDTATGSYGLGLGLTLLAPVAVFGLGVAIWRNLLTASAGALLVSLTHLFLYYPQVWSGWPQLLGILLVLGLWVVAIGYLERPAWQWGVLAGMLLGAIVVVHGTELYTSAIVLAILACANWRAIQWRRLGRDALVVALVALVCAAPYLPVLLHWAGGGGAYGVGNEDGSALERGTASALQLLGLFSLDALGVDFPLRGVLLALGLVFAFRLRTGGALVAVTAVFVAMAVIATLFNSVPLVRTVFAATYPWSLPYRHLTFASIGLAMIAGAGWVLAGRWWAGWLGRVRGEAAQRRLTRIGRILAVTWLALSCWALIVLLGIEAGGDVSFTADDAAAMAWLRANVRPGEVVVNDTYADAGIWAPYKAEVPIIFYRSESDPGTEAARQLVLANVGRLEDSPEAEAAACALNARYVYYGAANAAWQARAFPPVEELDTSSALEKVFESGESKVYRVRPICVSSA